MNAFRRLVWILIVTIPCMVLPDAAFADVVPSKPGAKPSCSAPLQAAMVHRGLNDGQARALTANLTPEDVRYFADSPERVQVVSGILFEDWVGAALLVVGIPLGIFGTLAAVRTYGN